jgi:hypothetical protein
LKKGEALSWEFATAQILFLRVFKILRRDSCVQVRLGYSVELFVEWD